MPLLGNVSLALKAAPSSVLHIRNAIVGSAVADVPGEGKLELIGENYNMGPAVLNPTKVHSADPMVAVPQLLHGAQLHLPRRASKWSALKPATAQAEIGSWRSTGDAGPADLGCYVDVCGLTGQAIGSVGVGCSVKVDVIDRKGAAAPPIPPNP